MEGAGKTPSVEVIYDARKGDLEWDAGLRNKQDALADMLNAYCKEKGYTFERDRNGLVVNVLDATGKKINPHRVMHELANRVGDQSIVGLTNEIAPVEIVRAAGEKDGVNGTPDLGHLVKLTGATIATGGVSVVEGLGRLSEGFVKTAAAVGTAGGTAFWGGVDLLNNLLFKQETHHAQDELDAMGKFLFHNYTQGAKEEFYNTTIGKGIETNSAISKDGIVNSVIAGLTETIASAGLGSATKLGPAVSRFIDIFGNATSSELARINQNQGNNTTTLKDFTVSAFSGALNAGWEALQMKAGMALQNWSVGKGVKDSLSNLKTAWDNTGLSLTGAIKTLPTHSPNFKTSLLRVLGDTAFNAADIPYKTAIGTVTLDLTNGKTFQENITNIYEDFKKNFEKTGGWGAVVSSVAMGAIGSILGEINEFRKPQVVDDGIDHRFDGYREFLKEHSVISKIVKNVPDNLSKPQKIAYAYKELCKMLSYEDEHAIFEIYNGRYGRSHVRLKVDEVDYIMPNESVVCDAWSAAFEELCIELGIDQSSIKVRGSGHKYVTIELESGTAIIADGTATLGRESAPDTGAIKMGDYTHGFLIVPKEQLSSEITHIYGDRYNYYRTPSDVQYVRDGQYLLNTTGYNSAEHELDLERIREFYPGQSEVLANEKLETFFEIYGNKNASLTDLTRLIRKDVKAIFGEDSWAGLYVNEQGESVLAVRIKGIMAYKVGTNDFTIGEVGDMLLIEPD